MNPSDNIIEKKVESSLISAEVNEKYLDDQNETLLVINARNEQPKALKSLSNKENDESDEINADNWIVTKKVNQKTIIEDFSQNDSFDQEDSQSKRNQSPSKKVYIEEDGPDETAVFKDPEKKKSEKLYPLKIEGSNINLLLFDANKTSKIDNLNF